MSFMRSSYLSGFSYRFQQLSQAHGQVTYVLLTRSPLSLFESKLSEGFVRLACIRHAASVHPEPGSNSPFAHSFTLSRLFSFCVSFIPYSSELTFPVQFSKIDRLAASRSALVYITILSFLRQHFFSLFSFFSSFPVSESSFSSCRYL